MSKLKIVYIVSTLVKSGPVNVLYNLVKFIDKTKFDITIITLSPESAKHSRMNEFKALGINLKSLNLSRLQGYFYGGLKLKKIVDEIQPDIIHTHCFRSNLFSALFLKKYKRCSTVHSDYKVDLTKLYPGIIGWVLFLLNHISLFLIKNNICCSEILAESLNKRYKYINFSYVNNGIDTEVFKPVANKISLRKTLNLPEQNKIFIWVGSFLDRKNPLLLVNTIKELNNPNLFFVFCGDGKLLPAIKEETEGFKNVIFTGNVDNISEYLQASDFYISTSLSEGLPMAVIEAMACGLPCVLSNIPQHKIVMKKDVGYTYNIDNIKELMNKINIILERNYKQLSLNSIEVIQNNFTAQIMSKNYKEIYDKIK